MICYKLTTNKGKITLENSLGYSITDDRLDYLLDFLLEPHPGQFKCFWNLNDEIAPILALLPDTCLNKLFHEQRTWATPYGITYFIDKVLRLVKGSYRDSIYNLSQYYPDHPEPETLQEAVELGSNMLKELETIGIVPNKLSSPITMILPILQELNLPNFKDIPNEISESAYELTGQTWTEAHQLGHWDRTYDYDITAAYGSVLANLLDIRKGKWIHSKHCPSIAVYGFARANVKITSNISPVIYVSNNGHLFNPKGSLVRQIDKQSIDCIEQYDLGSVNVIDGYWWIPQTSDKPLNLLINKLYSNRTKSPLLSRICKKAVNSIYGKMLEEFDNELGRLNNAVWGIIVEAEARIKVARFIFDNRLESHLIHVSTDGVLLDCEVPVPANNGMGNWRLDSINPALVVDSSSVFYGDKKPHQITYPEAMEMIKAKPRSNYWEKVGQRRVTIGDIVLGNWNRLGKRLSIVTGFRLPIEHDRIFKPIPMIGRQLLENRYTSTPIKIKRS